MCNSGRGEDCVLGKGINRSPNSNCLWIFESTKSDHLQTFSTIERYLNWKLDYFCCNKSRFSNDVITKKSEQNNGLVWGYTDNRVTFNVNFVEFISHQKIIARLGSTRHIFRNGYIQYFAVTVKINYYIFLYDSDYVNLIREKVGSSS